MADHVRYSDWGEASEEFDYVAAAVKQRDLANANEAQTRFDVIDRLIRDVLGWRYGNIIVEEHTTGSKTGYVDYILRLGDATIVIEAKRFGATFPLATKKSKLKLSGTVLAAKEVAAAIEQAIEYAFEKDADVAIVTNGRAWIFFSTADDLHDDSYANLLFPFELDGHAERLFQYFSTINVEHGSIREITNDVPHPEDRLIRLVRGADTRVDRNNIADHIVPALDNALYADALLSNIEALEYCYVTTEARARFDTQLGVHLADPKPLIVTPARRIKREKHPGPLDNILGAAAPSHAPPVTLIIGPVGAGKSTYLKHFELIAGREILTERQTHWVYIDFEHMGIEGSPREFLYRRLREYLSAEHPDNPTDYKNLVEPAYSEDIAALARGPLAPIFTRRELFMEKVAEHIARDYEAVEPYVDKLLAYLSSKQLCVIVLDNVDLYEDAALEARVFAEGLALSRRVRAHVIVSIRDTTFIKHRAGSVFDAYELRKLWLDPPPFAAVVSTRLSYSRKILQGESARIELRNGMYFSVPDLGAFFDIVQRSVLRGDAGHYIEAVADLNIRRGLMLVTNFLTSGHIQADRALREYIEGNSRYYFPFHEIFKGTMLGQWAFYKEERSECLNLFDAHLGSRRLRLLRLLLLNHLYVSAKRENTMEVPVAGCVELFSHIGASEQQVIDTIENLQQSGLIRNLTPEQDIRDARVVTSRSGAYYISNLCRRFVYAESCMFDTAIEDRDAWDKLSDLTLAIEGEPSTAQKMVLRRDRIEVFLNYLMSLEQEALEYMPSGGGRELMSEIRSEIIVEVERAVGSARRWYSRRKTR